MAEIFNALVASSEESLETVAADLSDDAVSLLNDLSMNGGGLDDPSRILRDCIAVLKRRDLGEEIEAIARELPLADDAEKDELVRRKQQLAAEIKALGGRRWPSFGRSRQ